MNDGSDAESRSRGEVMQIPVGSRAVRDLFNRHGVPSMRHVTLVAEILGFGYTPVHRRMKGEVAWEIEEVARVAAHFGETLAQVFAPAEEFEPVAAMLLAGASRIPCQLIPGKAVREAGARPLVAFRLGTQWVVAPPGLAEGPCFEVRKLLVLGEAEQKVRIAVLDDDLPEAAGLAEHLLYRGCSAEAFSDVEALVASLKRRPFDAYVIDWVLKEGTASELVAMIRSDDRDCPIAILTGKIETDLNVEPAVAEALSTYNLMFFQKPNRLQLISSQLLRALARR